MEITIEVLETMAAEMAGEAAEQHGRLARLCAAYVRIIAAREPERYRRQALHHGDVAGHWDGSYPPEQVYSDHSGPRAIEITAEETEDIATSGGYYHSWRRVTATSGLYVGPDGRWYHSHESGEGNLGQFAAHPGDVGVDCEISFVLAHADDLTVHELIEAERVLRDIAFPLIAARREATAEVRS